MEAEGPIDIMLAHACQAACLQRIITRKPAQLVALLSLRIKDKPLPWVQLVKKDLNLLWTAAACCCHLGDPNTSLQPWVAFMKSKQNWQQALKCVSFVDEIYQIVRESPSAQPKVVHSCWQCESCGKMFDNAKSRDAHARKVHGARVEQRFYSNAERVCQVCESRFRTNQRLLRHLCDSRRTKCWNTIMAKPELFCKLNALQVATLHTTYAAEKRAAKKGGLTHPVARGSASTRDGKRVGHVVR